MSPINAKHAGIVNRLGRLLRGLEPQQGLLSIQNPLRVDEMSEPEPDIAVLKPREDDYYESLPRPEDVLLLIEVADSSLKYDLGVKADLYAKAGIGEYWVVDLVNNGLIVHRDPTADGYRSLRTMEKDKTAVAQAFPELSIEMNELLP